MKYIHEQWNGKSLIDFGQWPVRVLKSTFADFWMNEHGKSWLLRSWCNGEIYIPNDNDQKICNSRKNEIEREYISDIQFSDKNLVDYLQYNHR